MKMYTPKLLKRYFFLSFAAAFVIFSGFFLLLASVFKPMDPVASVNQTSAADVLSENVYIPTESDSINVLFVGKPKDEKLAHTFMLIRLDPVKGAVPVTVFPYQTAVKYNEEIISLESLMKSHGVFAVQNALAQLLSAPIHRYAYMDYDGFLSCATAIGTASFSVPFDITVSENGVVSVIKAGLQLIDGKKAAEIIGAQELDAIEEKPQLAASLTAEIINQRMDICLSASVDNIFEKIINNIKTDISYKDYVDLKPAAEFVARLKSQPASGYVPTGDYDKKSDLFHIDLNFCQQLSKIYN